MSLSLFLNLLKQTLQEWLANNVARLGAALSFYSALSLSPLLVLFLAIASRLWGSEAAQGQIVNQMSDIVGTNGAQMIQSILAAAASSKNDSFVASAIGLISLLFSASAVFGELQEALNIIWHVKASNDKAYLVLLKSRFFSFMMVVSCGCLLLVSLVVSAGLAALSYYIDDLSLFSLIFMQLVNFVIGLCLITFIFALIFKTVPDLPLTWKSVTPGALLTALLFIAGKGLISLYIGHTGVGSSYGAAGSLIILLVWVYYSAQIFFFGAEFTYVYSSHFGLHKKAEPLL